MIRWYAKVRTVECPNCISLGDIGQIKEEHAVKAFSPGEFRWELADVIGCAHEEDIRIMIGQPGEQIAKQPGTNATVTLAAHSTESFFQFIGEQDARTHRIGNAECLAQIRFTLAHQAVHQGAKIEHQGWPASLIAQGFTELALART